MKRILKLLLMILTVFGLIFGLTACKPTNVDDPGNGNLNDKDPDNGEDPIDAEWFTDLSVRDFRGNNGVVSAANPYAAKAGLDVLQAGGNAFDAAVAMSFALGVVEPNASGLGGGGIMVAYNANEGKYLSYNFREFVPAAGTANVYGSSENTRGGIMSSGVPTQVAGLLKALEDNGNLTRQEVLKAAIDYAENGVKVTPELAVNINENVGKLMISKDEIAGVFSDEFAIEFLQEGDTLIQKNYAKALKLISEKGASGFYEGEVADAIVALQQAEGGIITHQDLLDAMNNYPKTEAPVQGSYRGYDIISATTPSSGGITLIQVLNMLEQYGDITELGYYTPEYIHVLATALTLAYADKRAYVGDSRMSNIPIRGLISKEYAAERWTKYDSTTAHLGRFGSEVGASDPGDPWPYNGQESAYIIPYEADYQESASTTSFSAADKDGNIVSVTQTINYFFGNGYVVPGFGFFMNNELSSLSFNATSPNYVRPGVQPVSHIMPTIIMRDGDPYLTIGSPGSMRIPSAVIQIVLNMIDFGMDIQAAIEAPRIYSYAMASDNLGVTNPGPNGPRKDIYIEKAFSDEIKEALESLNYYVIVQGAREIDLFFGGAQGIHFDGRVLHGGADPRRDGKALGY